MKIKKERYTNKMPLLIPLDLFYDPVKNTWSYYSKEQPLASKCSTLYWGVPRKPAVMKAYNDLQSPAGVLPMKAMVTLGNRPVIGPLIGILSAEKQNGKLKGNYNNYKAIMGAGLKIGGVVFVFTPSSVDWEKKSIRGKIFDRNNNRWVACRLPFPNVVYNRIQDRKHENKENSQECIRRFLSHPGITLFNRGFFNKQDVISTLSKSTALSKFIPETAPLLSKADLTNMLKRYRVLYLKPTDSRLGSGIIRVIRSQSQKPYTMQYYAGDKLLTKYRASNIQQLWKRIRKQMIGSPYIVQQAILLAVVSGCPFDCRVLVQKNRQGLWQISGMGIRVAEHSQSITTHVPRGGRIDTPLSVFRQAFPKQKPGRIEQRIHHLCMAVAKIMEKHHYPLGEISIDIGLDRSGHPWIFEVNAKPMKFDEPEIRKRQLDQIVLYAQFLTFHI